MNKISLIDIESRISNLENKIVNYLNKINDNTLVEVKYKLLSENAVVPIFKSMGASGMDIYPLIDNDIEIDVGSRKLFDTGISLEIPYGYEVVVRSRSGLSSKNGVIVLNSPGTIDSDYRGEIKVLIANLGEKTYLVKKTQAIAQLVLQKLCRAKLVKSDKLSSTLRGGLGFGSTDLN